MVKRGVLYCVVVLVAIFAKGIFGDEVLGAGTSRFAMQSIIEKSCKLQIPFIENRGQVKDSNIRFYADALGGTVSVTRQGELVYVLPFFEEKPHTDMKMEPISPLKSRQGWVLKERVIGASGMEPKGVERARTKVSCYLGKDPDSWRQGIPTYTQVSFGDVLDGIELVVRAYGKTVEKVFTLRPGAKVGGIALKIDGAKGLAVDAQGNLDVATGLGQARFTHPVAFQEKDGRREYVPAAYQVLSKDTYGFTVAAYDTSRPLVIDPLLASTYLGGSGSDWTKAITLDGDGNVYVAGSTLSGDFPTTPGAFDTSYANQEDAFVTKLDGDLTQVLASTYIGGTGYSGIYGNDGANFLAIDSDGNVYVAGSTASSNFPSTAGAYDTSFNGRFDTFVCRLDADLVSLRASTFLGGSDSEFSPRLVIHGDGDVFLSGYTSSSNFPTTTGAWDRTYGGGGDVYIARLNAELTELRASTLLGGTNGESLSGMALDADGNVYVAGGTWSSDYPVTSGAYNTTFRYSFVSKLNPDLTTLLASTFLGKGDPRSLAINAAGEVYLAGYTWKSYSPVFPTTPGAYKTSISDCQGAGDCNEAFVSKMNADLTTLLASTFFGGGGNDEPVALVLGSEGKVYVAGTTTSADFPATPGAFDTSLGGGNDAFVSVFDANLSTLIAASFLGGIYDDYGEALVIDRLGNLYITGETFSYDFPVTDNAYDEGFNGVKDTFITKLSLFSAALLKETFVSESDATETLAGQNVTLEDVVLSGTLAGTLRFTDLEMVRIETGAFAGKGFSRGTWEATIDGNLCRGTWEGMFFPNKADGSVELKGTVSGEISAIVEGALSESSVGSGLFDRYRANWSLNTVLGQKVSGTVALTGTASYESAGEYPETGLNLLQTSLEAEGVADFTDRLGVILTQVRVVSGDNPYIEKGFSILSYVADTGPGMGWTWDEGTSTGRVEMKGLFTGSLLGITAITMDETGPQRTLLVRLERLDSGENVGPMPDLEVATWGPDQVSPGLVIDFTDYMIAYCNRGAVSAQGAFLVDRLPVEVAYVSSTGGGIYHPESHEVVWDLGTLAPRQQGLVSVTGRLTRGLIENVQFDNQVLIGCVNEELDTVLNPQITALTPWWNEVMTIFNAEGPVVPWTPPEEDSAHNVQDDYYLDLNVEDAIARVGEVSPNECLELRALKSRGSIKVDVPLESQALWNGMYLINNMHLSGGGSYDIVGVNAGRFLNHYESMHPGSVEGYAFRHIPLEKQATMGTPEENQVWLAGIMVHENTHRKQTLGELWSGAQSGEIQAHQAQADFYISYANKCAKEGDYDMAYKSLDDADATWGMLEGRDSSWTDAQYIAGIGREYTATFRRLIKDQQLDEAEAEKRSMDELINSFLLDLPKDRVRNLSSHELKVALAHDPNAKYGPSGSISVGQPLDYRVEFENEGEGIAYGVYFTDTLDSDLDDSTLEIGPSYSISTGEEIGPEGIYDPQTRTITWFVGTVASREGGYADFNVLVREDAPDGTEVVNYGIVYFPSVPEETRTNGIVSIVGVEYPPVAVAGGPYEGAVGRAILFDAGGSYDEGTTGGISHYEWDWDGDGIFDETTYSPTVEHLWVEPFSGTITLQVMDRGGLTATDTASVQVVPMVPVARAGGPYTGALGRPVAINANNSSDPDGNIVRYEWDWDGNGSFDAETTSPNIEHTWESEYRGLIRLKVTDNDGLTGIGFGYVEVVSEQPQDCVVSDWSEWSDCSAGCGGGIQTRTRTIITEPANGGASCPDLEETRACNTQLCPQTWYKDADTDGYSDGATLIQAERPVGYALSSELTALSGDCDDEEAAVHPGAAEICGNQVDDNCDGRIDEECCAVNVTSGLSVTRSGYTYVRSKQRFVQTVTLLNTGSPVSAPIRFVLDGLPSTATLYTATGSTACVAPIGSPFVTVNSGPDNVLATNETVRVTLEFINPTMKAINYTARVLTGPNP